MKATAVLVVPCYNESDRFDATYWTQAAALDGLHIVFVDDGSGDATADVLTQFAADRSNVSVLVLERNVGKADAVRRGMAHAVATMEPPVCGFVDADAAVDVADLDALVDAAAAGAERDTLDTVWAARVALAGHHIQRSTRRHMLGRVIAVAMSSGGQRLPFDTQCGCKFFVTSAEFVACLEQPFRTRWFVDVELLYRLRDAHGEAVRVLEVPLAQWRDIPGSRITGAEVFRIVAEVLRVRRLRPRSTGPIIADRVSAG